MRQSNHLTNIYQNIIRVAQLMGAPVCSIPGERRRRDCGWGPVSNYEHKTTNKSHIGGQSSTHWGTKTICCPHI